MTSRICTTCLLFACVAVTLSITACSRTPKPGTPEAAAEGARFMRSMSDTLARAKAFTFETSERFELSPAGGEKRLQHFTQKVTVRRPNGLFFEIHEQGNTALEVAAYYDGQTLTLSQKPDLMGDRTSLTLHAGMKGMSENVFLNIKNRSLTITADVEIPQDGANGVILAQGGRFGRWSLYMKGGKPIYVYNFLGLQRFTVASPQAMPAGKATVRFEFAYDGGGLGKGGLGTLYVNDKKVAEGRIEHTQPMIFSADETADVGEDDATPVTEDYKAYDNKFTGKILKVTIDVKEMKTAEKAEENQGLALAAHKKVLSD